MLQIIYVPHFIEINNDTVSSLIYQLTPTKQCSMHIIFMLPKGGM